MKQRARTYTPPEALRWLAERSGPDVCEILDYAERALGPGSITRPRVATGSNPARDTFEQKIGAARTAMVVDRALQLGRAFLVAAKKPECIYLEGQTPDRTEASRAARELSRSMRNGESARLMSIGAASARPAKLPLHAPDAAFRLADELSGPGGAAAVYVGLSRFMSRDYREAARIHEATVRSAHDPHVRVTAHLSLVGALTAMRDYGRAHRVLVELHSTDGPATDALRTVEVMVLAAFGGRSIDFAFEFDRAVAECRHASEEALLRESAADVG